jgi:diaminopimelate decarboxylase
VTLSAFLLSVLSGNTPHTQAADRGSDVMQLHRTPSPTLDEEELRQCKIYRKSFAQTEIALPATVLRNRAIAKWVRDHRVTIDVHTGEELATALAAGVRLQRLTMYADALSESDLRAAVNLGVGRVVAASVQQIELMRSVVAKRAQDVVIRMTDVNTPNLATAGVADRLPAGFRFDSNESDTAIAAVLDHEWLNLVGLHCEVGSQDHDFVSYPAAIGHMIAEMTHIQRNHRVVLTRRAWAVAVPRPRVTGWSNCPNSRRKLMIRSTTPAGPCASRGRWSSFRQGSRSLGGTQHDRALARQSLVAS